MEFKVISESEIEILPCGAPDDLLLEAIARVSYELAETPAPKHVQPFDVPASSVRFRDVVTAEGLKLDYLNGRLCSTYVERRNDRLVFDARRFREDRGDPVDFLRRVREIMKEALKGDG